MRLLTTARQRILINTYSGAVRPPLAVAVFYGLIGVCYMMFGILGFLAELRFERLRNTVLWPFAFMLRYIGRGVTYVSVARRPGACPQRQRIGRSSRMSHSLECCDWQESRICSRRCQLYQCLTTHGNFDFRCRCCWVRFSALFPCARATKWSRSFLVQSLLRAASPSSSLALVSPRSVPDDEAAPSLRCQIRQSRILR